MSKKEQKAGVNIKKAMQEQRSLQEAQTVLFDVLAMDFSLIFKSFKQVLLMWALALSIWFGLITLWPLPKSFANCFERHSTDCQLFQSQFYLYFPLTLVALYFINSFFSKKTPHAQRLRLSGLVSTLFIGSTSILLLYIGFGLLFTAIVGIVCFTVFFSAYRSAYRKKN